MNGCSGDKLHDHFVTLGFSLVWFVFCFCFLSFCWRERETLKETSGFAEDQLPNNLNMCKIKCHKTRLIVVQREKVCVG